MFPDLVIVLFQWIRFNFLCISDQYTANGSSAAKMQGFERGMGTQLMHQSSAVHAAPSVAMIEDMASRLLSPAESEAVLSLVRRVGRHWFMAQLPNQQHCLFSGLLFSLPFEKLFHKC